MKREFLVLAALVANVFALPVAAQEPPSPMPAIPPAAQQQLEQMSRQGGPLQGASSRINRMTDPDAGKRPGDEKLSCEQIKAEFDETKKKYAAQQARRDSAKTAAEANAREAQAESSGPGAIAKGFVGGLGAVAARATGTGDAYNEKLKGEAIATQSRKEEVQMQFAQEAEASKAISDRGRALMSLGSAKSCQGLSYSP